MTKDELIEAKPVVEIDDVHMARAVVSVISNIPKEERMFRAAQMLAALREYYVRVGRATERLSCR